MVRLLVNSIRDWHGANSRPDMLAEPGHSWRPDTSTEAVRDSA